MYGLKQITLHNSYYNGLTVAVCADGHTNCSGTNAAGKTSMLQLVPFFFGCAPSKFNPKNKDKLPFLDFVLPSHSSMIIYDYYRQDGNCCAVVYRSSNNSVAYRFIKATSTEAFFNDTINAMMKSGAAAADMFSKMATMDIEMSTQLLTITEYSAVIQGDATTLRRMGDKARVRDAQRFGLATTSQPMRFIGEMTFTLLKRSRMYEELKRMIASTLFDYSAPAIPKHRSNEKLSRDLKGLREFEQRKGAIQACVGLHHERMHLVNAMGRYARGAQQSLAEVEAKQEQAEAQRAQLLETQDSLEARYEQSKSALTETRIEAEQKIKILSREIHNAENEQLRWFEANIAEKKADYESLADFREEAEAAEEHYQLLLTDSRKITDQRDSQINKIQARLNQRAAAFQQEKQACSDEIDQINAAHQHKLQALAKDESSEIEACQEAAKGQREGQLPELGRLNEAIKAGGLNDEEKLAEAAAEDKLETHEHKIDAVKDELDRQLVKVKQSKDKHADALARLEDTRKKIEACKTNIEHIESILYPADGTLLAGLRKDFPGWHNNIGKVIAPELLKHKDLTPVAAEGDSLYGLDIALDKLKPSEYAQEDAVLQEKLAQANTQKRLLEDDKTQQEALTQHLKTAWDAAETELSQLHHDLKLAQDARQAAKEYLQRVRLQHKETIAERKAELKAELARLEKRLKDDKAKHDQRLRDIRERFEARREALFDDCLTQRSEVEARMDQLRANFEEANARAEEDIAEVKDAYKRKSKDQGIDETTLQAAKARARAAQDRYKQVQAFGDMLHQYEQWQRNVWAHIDSQRAEHGAAQSRLSEAQEGLQDLKTDYDQQKATIKRQIKALEQELTRQNELLNNARELLKAHGPVLEGEAEQGQLAALCSELQVMLRRESELRRELLQSVTDALMAVQANPESKIYEAWKQLNDARLTTSAYSEHSELYRLNLPLDLDTLLHQHVPLIRDAIIEAIKSVGGAFEEFYRTMRQLEADVGRVNRELKEKVNTNQRIAALRDIELALSSKISTTVDGWEDLEAFIRGWDDWDNGLNNNLPPESLELALSRVITSFQSSNIKMDIGSLFDLEIHMVESGRPTCINSNAAFDDASSNGLSYLALIVIFVGLSRYLCPDTNITLTWPIDELATLDPKNVASMFTMLKNNNIEVFSAFPSTDYNLLQHFANRYTLERQTGARQYLDGPSDNPQIDNMIAALEGAQ